MSKATKYIKQDQWTKINANRKRLADAQDREEREAELIRQLNNGSAQRAVGVQSMHHPHSGGVAMQPPCYWRGIGTLQERKTKAQRKLSLFSV